MQPSQTFNPHTIKDPLTEALKVLTPAWPLQNTVAVNPFWNMRERPFSEVLSQLSPALHQQLLMPIEYFREKYRKGEILPEALPEALDEARTVWSHLPRSVPELLNLTCGGDRFCRAIETVAEMKPHNFPLNDFVVDQVGKFAAAYFDQSQALIKFPWQKLPFWEAWLKAQRVDQTVITVGFTNAKADLKRLEHLKPTEAIEHMLAAMGITSTTGQFMYLQRAAAGVMGWGSQFRYHEWQKSLGYDGYNGSTVSALIAVRVAYDYIIYKDRHAEYESLYRQWSDALNSTATNDKDVNEFFGVLYTWQLALELSYQQQVGSRLLETKEESAKSKLSELVFCIDVRSEMIRRHIESVDVNASTRGFAGFFAAAVDYKKCDEKSVGHRFPVLLKPAVSIVENVTDEGSDAPSSKQLARTVFASYFRNLRKMPLSSFLFVELFGILAIGNLLRRTMRSFFFRKEFEPRFSLGNENALNYASKQPLTLGEKAGIAANALRHMGLKDNFAKLTVIVGHGAKTYNNAFASALDCGACGGHAGDLNARFMVSLLNNSEVRSLLVKESFVIPSDTLFMAALHETVTDEIHFIDEETTPKAFLTALSELKSSLEKASKNCRTERQTARSHCLDTSSKRRSSNWSEVRPEWGLSGNACFVVAPRARTRGMNLSSRAFLHDYDWRTDNEFKTLELIMTAPMVVTNWINMQYFGSVVAPRYYSSGNKVLHNLTNETGVLEGNGGDLRIGLPIQSIHDGEKFVHDPLRLTVFIEAPREEIEKIIEKHAVVRDLVTNQWLHIAHIDGTSSRVWRRLKDGTYKDVLS